MSPEVCLGTWMFAEKYQLQQLADTALAMALDQTDQAVDSEEILELPRAMLLVLLGSQRTLTMDDVCRTILRWVEGDLDSRQTYFHHLLPFVSFPQLSPGYIRKLMKQYYFDHPFSQKYLAEGINDAVCFNLRDQKRERMRQIIARQDRVATSPLIRKCAVVVGGSTDDDSALDDVSAFWVKPEAKVSVYAMKPLPQSIGIHFASCVWKNELYVSGGTKKTAFFARYIPGDDEWEVLPDLPHGLMKHAMAAVNGKIYVLGGFTSLLRTKPSQDILVYDVSSKMWGVLDSKLPLAVQGAAVAVLGHRVYTFGGKDAGKEPADRVQCLDTSTGCLYQAGSLSFPTADVVAMSDGGTVYLLCQGNRVLKMKEHFLVANRKELLAENAKETRRTRSAALDQDQAQDKETQADCDVATTDPSPSVTFSDVGAFADVRFLSGFLHDDEMVACGGQNEDGSLTREVKGMNLMTGVVATRPRQALGKPLKNFKLQTLNIPLQFLNEDTATRLFIRGDKVRLKEGSDLLSAVGIRHDAVGTVDSVRLEGLVTVVFSIRIVTNQMMAAMKKYNHTVAAANLLYDDDE